MKARSIFGDLLDKVIAQAGEIETLRDERGDLQSRIRIVEQERDELRRERDRTRHVNEHYAAGEPRLRELWEAAEDVRKAMGHPTPEQIERLRVALLAASNHCDLIPF